MRKSGIPCLAALTVLLFLAAGSAQDPHLRPSPDPNTKNSLTSSALGSEADSKVPLGLAENTPLRRPAIGFLANSRSSAKPRAV